MLGVRHCQRFHLLLHLRCSRILRRMLHLFVLVRLRCRALVRGFRRWCRRLLLLAHLRLPSLRHQALSGCSTSSQAPGEETTLQPRWQKSFQSQLACRYPSSKWICAEGKSTIFWILQCGPRWRLTLSPACIRWCWHPLHVIPGLARYSTKRQGPAPAVSYSLVGLPLA